MWVGDHQNNRRKTSRGWQVCIFRTSLSPNSRVLGSTYLSEPKSNSTAPAILLTFGSLQLVDPGTQPVGDNLILFYSLYMVHLWGLYELLMVICEWCDHNNTKSNTSTDRKWNVNGEKQYLSELPDGTQRPTLSFFHPSHFLMMSYKRCRFTSVLRSSISAPTPIDI